MFTNHEDRISPSVADLPPPGDEGESTVARCRVRHIPGEQKGQLWMSLNSPGRSQSPFHGRPGCDGGGCRGPDGRVQ